VSKARIPDTDIAHIPLFKKSNTQLTLFTFVFISKILREQRAGSPSNKDYAK